MTPKQAIQALQSLRARDNWEFWPETTSLAENAALIYPLNGYKQVTDLYLLNLAQAHKGQLLTFDQKIVASLKAKDRQLVRVWQGLGLAGGF